MTQTFTPIDQLVDESSLDYPLFKITNNIVRFKSKNFTTDDLSSYPRVFWKENLVPQSVHADGKSFIKKDPDKLENEHLYLFREPFLLSHGFHIAIAGTAGGKTALVKRLSDIIFEKGISSVYVSMGEPDSIFPGSWVAIYEVLEQNKQEQVIFIDSMKFIMEMSQGGLSKEGVSRAMKDVAAVLSCLALARKQVIITTLNPGVSDENRAAWMNNLAADVIQMFSIEGGVISYTNRNHNREWMSYHDELLADVFGNRPNRMYTSNEIMPNVNINIDFNNDRTLKTFSNIDEETITAIGDSETESYYNDFIGGTSQFGTYNKTEEEARNLEGKQIKKRGDKL